MTSELGVLEMRDHKPDDFTAKLSKGELPNPEQLTVVGMVKAVEGSSSTVSFTNSLKCEHWLPLPIDIVDSFTHLKNVTCKDHEHPLVKVKFKRPGDLSPEVAFFAVLYARMGARLVALLTVDGGSTTLQGCEVLKFDGEAYICCDGECGGLV
ncbi:hypothetical protein [Streptomyces calvus]